MRAEMDHRVAAAQQLLSGVQASRRLLAAQQVGARSTAAAAIDAHTLCVLCVCSKRTIPIFHLCTEPHWHPHSPYNCLKSPVLTLFHVSFLRSKKSISFAFSLSCHLHEADALPHELLVDARQLVTHAEAEVSRVRRKLRDDVALRAQVADGTMPVAELATAAGRGWAIRSKRGRSHTIRSIR